MFSCYYNAWLVSSAELGCIFEFLSLFSDAMEAEEKPGSTCVGKPAEIVSATSKNVPCLIVLVCWNLWGCWIGLADTKWNFTSVLSGVQLTDRQSLRTWSCSLKVQHFRYWKLEEFSEGITGSKKRNTSRKIWLISLLFVEIMNSWRKGPEIWLLLRAFPDELANSPAGCFILVKSRWTWGA